VAFAERSNIKEGKSLVTLEELETRDITYADKQSAIAITK
jgi:hypothetical protein